MSLQSVARAAVVQWSGRTVAGKDLPTVMTAIDGAESGWTDNAAGDLLYYTHNCHGYVSWGSLQVNINAHWAMLVRMSGLSDPCAIAKWLYTPANTVRSAQGVIGSTATDLPASALHPWTTWWSPDGNPQHDAGDGNGIYLKYMQQAHAAVQSAYAALTKNVPPSGSASGFAISELPIIGAVLAGLFVIDEGVTALRDAHSARSRRGA